MTKRKNNTYSKEFKEKAVQLYLEGGESYQSLSEKLGLRDRKQLRNWVAKVQRGETLDDMRGKHTAQRKGCPKTNFTSVEEELAYVKAERDYLKKLYRSRFGKEWGADE